MSIMLYAVQGENEHLFSPFAWRAFMAIAHKEKRIVCRGIALTDIPKLSGGSWKTVPTIVDNERIVTESHDIADYLEGTYADRPSLFDSAAGRDYAAFVQAWTNTVLHPQIARFVLHDMHAILKPEDRDYFWSSRSERFGMALDKLCAERESRLQEFRKCLGPMRQVLAQRPFLGGHTPLYVDYIVFGALQWARSASPFALLEPNDRVLTWFDRCLDLHGGLARKVPAYAWHSADGQ